MLTRPSESLTAAVGTVVAAALVILAAVTDIEVSEAVTGVIILAVSWIAAAVTAYISRRQKAGALASGTAGEVTII